MQAKTPIPNASGIVAEGFSTMHPGISYAIYNIITKIALKGKRNAVTVTLYSFFTMAVIAMSVANPEDIISKAARNPLPSIPLLIGLGIATFVTPYFLYTLAMRDLPAGTASALGIIEPMAATIFSVVIFNEVLSVSSVIGIIMILGSVFVLSRQSE